MSLEPRIATPWSRWRSFVALAILPIAACAAGDAAPPKSATTAGSSVESLIGDAACDSDAQCRTVGVGAKACGGPQRYVAWSAKRTDEAALRGAADREMREARVQVEKSGVMSNCAVTVDPGAYCVAATHRCETRPAGSGGATKIY